MKGGKKENQVNFPYSFNIHFLWLLHTTRENADINSPCLNFLFNETLNHLVTQIIDRLHVSGF